MQIFSRIIADLHGILLTILTQGKKKNKARREINIG
jgi:hypothetical protein